MVNSVELLLLCNSEEIEVHRVLGAEQIHTAHLVQAGFHPKV